jgi:hypothetical protein
LREIGDEAAKKASICNSAFNLSYLLEFFLVEFFKFIKVNRFLGISILKVEYLKESKSSLH